MLRLVDELVRAIALYFGGAILIGPPVGINVFIVKGLVPGVPIDTIFRGIWPFWFAMALCIAILMAFPGLVLFLPSTMLS